MRARLHRLRFERFERRLVVAARRCLGSRATVLSLERTQALDFNWGVQAGEQYGVWPMLIGGFFLYTAYYGCDQSQAQRVLAARSPRTRTGCCS